MNNLLWYVIKFKMYVNVFKRIWKKILCKRKVKYIDLRFYNLKSIKIIIFMGNYFIDYKVNSKWSFKWWSLKLYCI